MKGCEQIIELYKKNGGYIHKSLIRKKNKDNIYGIFTNEKIEKNTLLIKTPSKLILGINNNISFDEKTPDLIKIVISILVELYKKEDSIFYHSFLLLPKYKEINDIIIFNDEYLQYLNEIGFNNQLKDYRNLIIREVTKLNDKYNYISELNEKDIRYGFYIYHNYSWNGGLDILMHLLNHKYGSPARKKIPNSDDYCYMTNKMIEKDEEIFDTYGDIYSNERFALYYNFIDNSEKNTTISFRYKDKSALGFYKSKLLYDYCIKNLIPINYSFDDGKEVNISIQKVPNIGYLTKFKITDNNYEQLFNIASILSINKLEHINNREVLLIYNYLRDLLQMNLDTINKSNLEKYRNKIKENYPIILSMIENKINILTNLINKVNKNISDLLH
ncbi:uncharacterized protein METZ01_LOCUS80333 [marine metagenome]|uniref:SET domain-containing protein n=1 Tax=marine metagenome TaxID=408172 RepID=A0A381UH50_9ZZZZ